MKIVPKLTVAFVAGTCAILAINGYFRVRREVAFFESERLVDHDVLGRTLGSAVTAVWESEGERPALETLGAVRESIKRIRIEWLGVGKLDSWQSDVGSVAAATLRGKQATRVLRPVRGDPIRYTQVPVDVDGVRRGVIELSESATAEHHFVRGVVIDTVSATTALVLLSALLSFLMGQWLIGRPVRELAEKARRIGRGDFSMPITLKSRDELSVFAEEMNAMCERLVSTLGQLRHADRLATVGTLASGMAHELGTPLNVVSARAAMIAAGDTTPEETRDYARIVLVATGRMTKIIQQLLQFARRTGPQKAPRDLRELTASALELLRPLADKRGVRLEFGTADVAATVLVDAGQFHQVVTNLVMNAVQAMQNAGSVHLELRVERVHPPADVESAEGTYLCLRVTDEGQGISPDDLPHIFEPFFTTKDVGEGTGLGLAVAYGIVREHGGWIGVESQLHNGTTFSVFLPVVLPVIGGT